MREGERSKIESEESCQSSNLGSTSAHCAHSFKGEIQCDPTHSPVVLSSPSANTDEVISLKEFIF